MGAVNNQTRAEIRYYVDQRKAPKIRKTLSHLMNRDIFPDPYNQTLYFNNDEHEVPFTYSIRARRYEHRPLRRSFRLQTDDKWILEFKTTRSVNGRFIRYKRRDDGLRLGEIVNRVGKIRKLGGVGIPHKLVPYSAASYVRNHFLENMRGVRVTVDEDVRFYKFTKDLSGKMMGRADHAIVELKIPPHRINSGLSNEIQHTLRIEGAHQGVSKKATTFNLIDTQLRKTGQAYKIPRHDTEIEAKIALDSDGQDVFHDLREAVEKGKVDGFKLSPRYPRVIETGKLHQYILTPSNDYVRIETRREAQYLTVKEELEVAQDPYDLGNVIRRREVTEPTQPGLLKQPSRTLQRKRKYFMVEKPNTLGKKNEYAVVIDRTTHRGHELYQMEIGDVLNSPSFDIEKASVADVASIANFLVDEYSLEPTTLTKGEWLMSLPN
ncbi:MAG TPA: VTC domain-containing protein [Candidatus Binatus sp.]|nr:VTC domain-containing protein [Candidatus Binatus sp.]